MHRRKFLLTTDSLNDTTGNINPLKRAPNLTLHRQTRENQGRISGLNHFTATKLEPQVIRYALTL